MLMSIICVTCCKWSVDTEMISLISDNTRDWKELSLSGVRKVFNFINVFAKGFVIWAMPFVIVDLNM